VKALSGREFARMLEAQGWSLQRINGSHHIYAKAGVQSAFPFRSMAMNRSKWDLSATS
jgi:predicted RNA binding protein YcfA (HicA-like mRNA interferase family)